MAPFGPSDRLRVAADPIQRVPMPPQPGTPAVVSRLRVRYAETDKAGIVYYANFFIWFEVARTDLLRAAGWTYRGLEADGFALPVIEAHCDYRKPALYDDEIDIRTRGAL